MQVLRQPQCPECYPSLRAAPAPASHEVAAIGVSVGVSAVLVAAVLAALYAWHRLRGGRVPLIAWLTSGGKAPSSGGSGVRAGLSMMPRGPVCRLQVAPLENDEDLLHEQWCSAYEILQCRNLS